MNRTIKEATVKRFHYGSHDQLRGHRQTFVSAYNFGRRLQTLRGLTLRIDLQSLDKRPQPIHAEFAPSNAGTKHLARLARRSRRIVPILNPPAATPLGMRPVGNASKSAPIHACSPT
jgi:hypothetical protein